ncbi:cytochrome b pre-mRNA-processing protein 6 [Gigaspora margarita]|uniref:Cytochrome b pre-mRNA-processing protein 6 n=1 Tax=Gigaspora margarita TaxID=4874 RepID=A0A8H4A2R9_GIGMA|nr:cytochrome b pre-mRNA-processing protein 6 [Gigaspora margarita]
MRTDILSLYRSFLRVIERWPTDYLRPTRNFKHVLHLRVTEGFRQNLSVKDKDVLRALVMDAETELDALRRLANNEFKEKYPLSDRIYRPAANPKYYSGLVTAIDKAAKLKQEEDLKPSLWKRLFS